MPEATKLEFTDYLRSGVYSKPIIALDITLPYEIGSGSELEILGGVLSVATEYVNTGDVPYWGTLSTPLGLRKAVNSRLFGSPPESNAVLTIRISGSELPDWMDDLRNIDFNGAQLTIKVGGRGWHPDSFYQVDTGFISNASVADTGEVISFTFLRTDSYMRKEHGHLTNSFVAADGGIGQSMPFGKVPRVHVSPDPVLNFVLTGGTTFTKKGRWAKGITYSVNDVVTSSNTGRTYKCIATGSVSAGDDKDLSNGSDTGTGEWNFFFESWDYSLTWDSTMDNAAGNLSEISKHINDDKAFVPTLVWSNDHKCSVSTLFQGDRWGVATTAEDDDDVNHTIPNMTLEVDIEHPFGASATSDADEILGLALEFCDNEHLPFPQLIDIGLNFKANNQSQFNNASFIFQCGYAFSNKDAKGKLTHYTWYRAMDHLIGSIGGSWVTDRFGVLTLLYYTASVFWAGIDISGTLQKSDFTEHTRKRLPEYEKVILTGLEYQKVGTPEWAHEKIHDSSDNLAGRSNITIKSAISDPADASIAANKISRSQWMIHTFHGCRVGMAFEAGDKISFFEDVDDILKDSEAYVVSAPISESEPLILAVEVT